MALRSGDRKLSFDILADSEYEYLTSAFAEPDAAISRSHSDPAHLQNGASASSPPRKRKKRKSRKGKSSFNSEIPTADTPLINGDLNYSCTLSTVTEAASVVPDLDCEVTLSSVYGALRQRNVGNGGCSEVNSDDSGSSKKDDSAKEEVAENWNAGGKETAQQGPEMNGRKLEKDGTLDWKEWMAEDANYILPMDKSPVKYFLEEVHAGYSLRSTTTLGNDKERERVYDTIFRLPWRCELLINIGFFVCFDSFLSLLTIMPTRIVMVFWKLLRTRQFKRLSSPELSDFGCFIALIIGVTLLQQADISLIYHMIRGQGIIKLYVVYNVLEVFDKLCQSFGGDVMQALFNSADGLANCSPENMQFWMWRFVSDEALAVAASDILLITIHTCIAITLSTCIVAHNNALFAMLVSNNFAEIKSNVFKRYSKDNVQSLVYFDSVERFHITAFILFVLAQNILEAEGPWFESFLSNALVVYICEVMIDIIKHSFISKFNGLKPTAFSEFLEDLCKQTLNMQTENSNKNLTFVPLAPACVVIRVLRPVYAAHLPYNPLPWRLFWMLVLSGMTFVMLASLKMMIGMGLRKHATWYVKRCQSRKLHSD
ncbi:hypothetical protein SASPL_140557 [Salvia splendens]|uniref:Protein POLLEN DEFECTIVE IN GUIDANCE 1 n=1 Tax=Salvia splendens TaxID=180675 RepID=A0A8X8WPZ2_SALSN|nr:hypothetical protein SASPL_140557 [Salvia splendens]